MSRDTRAGPGIRGAVSQRGLALCAFLRFLERLALVLATTSFAAEGRGVRAYAFAATLAFLYLARSAATARLRARAQQRLHELAIAAILGGDVMSARILPTDDPQTAIFEGVYFGSRLVAEVIPDLAGDVVAVVLLVPFLFAFLPGRLLALGVVAVVIAATSLGIARRLTTGAIDEARRRYIPVADGLAVGIGARLELVAGGRRAQFEAAYHALTERWLDATMKSDALGAFAGRIPVAAAAATIAIALLADPASRDAIAVGAAATFASVVPAFLGVARGGHELLKIQRKLAGFRALLARAAGHAIGTGVAPPSLPADVAVRHVAFAYPSTDGGEAVNVLDDVSFDWSPGRVLMLVGPNGSGKSTLMRLILGLAAPSSGSITIAGTDLAKIDLAAYRRRIAFVPQRPFLPERGSVADAIRLLARDADDAKIRAALDRVGLLPKLETLSPRAPLDTPVVMLSIGERQRVGLARALAEDASMVLFDEPDANLDHDGIDLVRGIVRELARDKMVAVVAHTEALVSAGDHIVSLGPRARS